MYNLINHHRFMRMAIALARKGDWPYGALLVKDNVILAEAYNTTDSENDTTAHAEVNVIRKALKANNGQTLNGSTIYTTGEPCPMCTGAIIWAGISQIVYSASIPLLIKIGQPQINTRSSDIIRTAPDAIEIVGGILESETVEIIKNHQVPSLRN